MTVTRSQRGPSIRKEPEGFILPGGCIVPVYRCRLAPYADVRIIFSHPRDEIFIIIGLVGPHPVLDIPVEDPQIGFSFCHQSESTDFDIVEIETVDSTRGVVACPVEHCPVCRIVNERLHTVPRLGFGIGRRHCHIILREDISACDPGEAGILIRQLYLPPIYRNRLYISSVQYLEQQQVGRARLIAEIERDLHGTQPFYPIHSTSLEYSPAGIACTAGKDALIFLTAEHIGIVPDITACDIRIGHLMGRCHSLAGDLIPGI